MNKPAQSRSLSKGLSVGALGVVFGDIGTSPLYTVQTVFSPQDPHPVAVTTESIYGVISLIFWAVVTIVMITYVLLVMRADNEGEGGVMALLTLVSQKSLASSRKTKAALAALGLFGASLFFGDSMITPAISVLSAVQGLKVAAPSLTDFIIPITVAVLIVLFMFQRFGTASVGRMFGPVMVVWFVAIGAFGIHGIVEHPEILKALSPSYALDFMINHLPVSFFALGAVVLAVTGAEALYADMGHFGRLPIIRAWMFLVFPACILSYMGQGALILGDPQGAIGSPFFQLGPEWAQIPMVLLATAATVIASQAVITGAYSVTHQAIQLGYLPRLRIRHTSDKSIGQIYVPWINWLLLVAVISLVLIFRSSEKLAFAYGVAVTGTITITTLLYLYYARQSWHRPMWMIVGGGAFLLTVDLLFFSANITKLFHGAWLPLVIGILVFTVLTTWRRGRTELTDRRQQLEGPLQEFIDEINTARPDLVRVPGTGVFLNRNSDSTPLAMRACADRLNALHEHVVILTIETAPVPYLDPRDQLVVDDLGYSTDGISRVRVRFGYMDQPNVPEVLRMVDDLDVECPLEVDTASFFLSEIELRAGHLPGMARWRKHLFVATSHIAADAADYFGLPQGRTITLGSRVEV